MQDQADGALAAAVRALGSLGYEPVLGGPLTVGLRNCPFDGLVSDHGDLVCAMSLDLVEGIVGGVGSERFSAVLDPRPGWCCVKLAERAAAEARPPREVPGTAAAAGPPAEDRRSDAAVLVGAIRASIMVRLCRLGPGPQGR